MALGSPLVRQFFVNKRTPREVVNISSEEVTLARCSLVNQLATHGDKGTFLFLSRL